MALPKVYANFSTSLAAKMSSSATTGTLNVSVDDDGATLAGSHYLTIDEGTSSEEHIICTLTGASISGATRGISRVDGTTSQAANQFEHSRGASVKITDMNLIRVTNRLNGGEAFDSPDWTGVQSIAGLTTPTSGETTKAANVDYVNIVAIAGAPDSAPTVKGLNEMATSGESQAGTDVGSTTGPLVVAPSDIAANAQNQQHTYLADSGAADAYVITLAPAIAAYAAGQRFTFLATSACTGASTLNVNGLGAKDIRKSENGTVTAVLANNDILAAQIVTVVYDGTQFLMDSPLGTRATSAVNYEAQTFFSDSNNVVQIDEYTTDDTWTKPTGAVTVEVICVGAGGGGGGASLQNTSGGAGGGGGAVSLGIFNAADLGATETITVGVGGSGGTANPGVNGSNGTASSFGTWLTAGGGGGGPKGLTANNTGGGGGGAIGDASGTTGGSPAASGSDAIGGQGPGGQSNGQYNAEWGGGTGGGSAQSTTGQDGGSSIYGAGGGGGGAGYNGGDIAGGDGGVPQSYTAGGGAAGGAGSAGALPGTAGSTNAVLQAAYGGGGGGGGNGHTGNNPGDGGAGGAPGGGGGGGGSAQNVGAAGGAGAAGKVKVITHRTSV